MKDFKICTNKNCFNFNIRVKITNARYILTEEGLVPKDEELVCDMCGKVGEFKSEKEDFVWTKPPLIKGLSTQEPELDEKSVLKRQDEEKKYGRKLRWYEER